MYKHKIINTQPLCKKARDLLAEHCEIVDAKITDLQTIFHELPDTEGILTSGALTINKELLDLAPNLKIVSNVAVGYNNFSVPHLRDRNVLATYLPGVLDDSVADLAFTLMLATARRVCELDKYTKTGHWDSTDISNLFGLDLHHKSLGIIGMGRIGEALAKRAALGFDMKISYYNRSPRPEAEKKYNARYTPLDTLLSSSDFVVLLTPLTPETHKLIGYKELNLMKHTAILVNVSRGQVVDEKALIQALREKKIYGAGLDVFEREPVSPYNPLLKMKNVVTLPHIGSATQETRDKMAIQAAENLLAGLQGHMPANVIPELL